MYIIISLLKPCIIPTISSREAGPAAGRDVTCTHLPLGLFAININATEQKYSKNKSHEISSSFATGW